MQFSGVLPKTNIAVGQRLRFHVNFSCDLGPQMTRYDLLEARRMILSKYFNRLQLALITLLVNKAFLRRRTRIEDE